MTCMYVWHLGAVLSLLAVPGEQHAQPLAAPQILKVYSEEDKMDLGVWKMNIDWREGFTRTTKPRKATYDLRIFHTEYRRLVHNETVEVTPDLKGLYHRSWTSPIPLQCTSHSVQLRLREDNNTSEWSDEYTLEGSDTKDEDEVYPQNHKVLVNEGIVFCCILHPDKVKDFTSFDFTVQISNRTFITKPVRYPDRTLPSGEDIVCDDSGATFYTGYPPDVHNLTCETQDLSSVECHWSVGRKHGFVNSVGNMTYSLNGRACAFETLCVLEQSVESGVTNWTFTAENILGKRTLTDVADPKHRVRLKAPCQARASDVGEQSAELGWTWEIKNYMTFPITCQVQLNGLTVNESFNGSGLHSASLKDLQTSTNYKAQVRCGAQEHFYTWSDWSDPVTFRTKPDSSKAADVWMQVLGEQTSVVWKPFSTDYNITSFELLLGNAMKPVTKPPSEFCYQVEPASTERHIVVSVSAKNSEWTSPASNITLPNLSESGVSISAISASNGGFYLDWEPDPVSTCGYVVDWYPTYRAEPCAIKWIKVSSRVYSAHVQSDYLEGVSYTLSVYACTSGAPKLLQRREGYIKELAPSGAVQNLKAKQRDSEVCLSWDEVLKVEQRGVILGYNVSHSSLNRTENKWTILQDPSSRKHSFTLRPGTYKFTVKALTSAGEGPETSVTLAMNPPTEKIIMIIICILAAVTCTLAVLYRKRNWLKSVLSPDIPKPGLSEEWLAKRLHQCQLIDKLLTAEREVLKICYPEPSSPRTSDQQKEDKKAQLLEGPGFQNSPLVETWELIPEHEMLHPVTDTAPVTPVTYTTPVTPVTYTTPVTPVTYTTPVTPGTYTAPITIDFSYMEVPCAAVQNPTYSIPVEHLPVPPLAPDIVVTPYIPQKQNIAKQR